MSEEQPSDSEKDTKIQRSWVERLGQALQGELKDREQLMAVLNEAHKNNVIDHEAFSMIDGALQVAEMQVRDIMLPRSQMIVLEMDLTEEELLDTVVVSAHSRFPVIGDSKDEVVGILLAKDLLPHFIGDSDKKLNVREILRPAVFIPESKRLNVLLKEFKSTRNHIAIVVDEYGGVAGMVTIEDVLEQIVGEIEDEHDFDEDTYIFEHAKDRATVKAITPLEDFNKHFGTKFTDDEFDTIGGIVMHALGHVPKRGESVIIDNLEYKILRSTNRRISLLEIFPYSVESDKEATESADVSNP
ncbi:MAG: CBS domain-containing protein [Gammaproteobacteria bacterium]|nr:CBS domain-containing protein [Gammaproteobacteria bacterium]MDH5659625.1 CBS domain-containing protein [Gammaproteobacteria bacterium]